MTYIKKLLFVCTGNTCRSPMAAGIMNMLLREKGVTDVIAVSAGLAANEGECASANAVKAAAALGVNINDHTAHNVDKELTEQSEIIYVMTQSHKSFLESAYPECKNKIYILGGGIPDPFGGDLDEYKKCRDNILEALKDILKGYK